MSPDGLKEIEDQLKQMRPAPLDAKVSGRIQTGLRLALRRKRLAHFRASAGWAGLALAASILITFGFLLFNGRLNLDQVIPVTPVAMEIGPEPVVSDPSSSEDPFKQVFTENSLQSRVDEGIVFLKNGMTARRYRYQFVDRVIWENPADGAMVELEVPRDEIVLIPVQTF